MPVAMGKFLKCYFRFSSLLDYSVVVAYILFVGDVLA